MLMGVTFCLCAVFWSAVICSYSSGHPWISSFSLSSCLVSLSSRNCTSSSSSTFEPPPTDSSLELSVSSSDLLMHAHSISQGDCLGDCDISRPREHKSCGEGGTKRGGSGDGAFDCMRDGAMDGALNCTQDSAMDGASNCA